MKKHLFSASIILLLSFLNLQAQTVSVAVPETLKVAKGEQITVPVTVSGLPETNIFDFDGELQFDEAVLDFQGATCVGTIAQKWGEPIFNAGLDGRAIFANYANQELTPLTAVGTLILLDFAVVGDFSDTTSLSWAKMNFTRDANVTTNVTPGFVAVNPAPIVVTVTTGMGAGTEIIVDGVTHRAPYSASWAPGEAHSISCPEMQTAGETIRYFFESWSNGADRTHSVAPTENTTYVAALRTEYYCDVRSDFGETSGSGWYAANTEVAISVDSLVDVDADRRLLFNSWKGAGTGAYSGSERNATFLILGPVTQTADFTPQYRLEVMTLPENLTVLLGSGWYSMGDTATTSAAPEMIGGRYFRGWLVDGEGAAGNPVSIVMDAPHTAVANYAEDVSVIVTTTVGTGTRVFVDGVSYDAPAAFSWFAGTVHEISVAEVQNEATGSRQRFVSWSDGGERIHQIYAEASVEITAELKNEYFVSMQSLPSGILSLEGSGWYEENQIIDTDEVPELLTPDGAYYSFYSWVVNDLPVDGNPVSVQVTEPMNLEAQYYENFYIIGQVLVGTKPLPSIQVNLSGAVSKSAFTDANGFYKFFALEPNMYTVTPISEEYNFEPAVRQYRPLFFSQKKQDFVAPDEIPPTVTVIYPNGGEELTAGKVEISRWTATDNIGIDSVFVYCSLDAGTSWTLVAEADGNSETAAWQVPQTETVCGKIKIIARDFGGQSAEDISDASFEIKNSNAVDDPLPGKTVDWQLNQNYPNPFNPSTTIQFSLPTNSKVTIQIFDIAGRKVKNLVDGQQNAGTHQVTWQADDEYGRQVSTGIYLCRMIAGNEVLHRKLIFAK